jgi:Ni/Fe-hydrogenase subunit HybB-like protein
MSLDPLWYSTILAVYNFSGLFTSGLAMMLLLVLWLRKGPLAEFVRDSHVEDLGKVLFAFCTFWMYIWFCQYMLIWYANIPEETAYYVSRMSRFWLPLFVANVVLNWLAPFFLLLTNASKRNPRILCAAAIIVLVGRFVDLFLMVTPAVYGDQPVVGILEISVVIGALCVFLWTFLNSIQSSAVGAVYDRPFLKGSGESL